MKVVVAMDSFKGSMSSLTAGYAVKTGIDRVLQAEVVVRAVADGGEGTTEALVEGLGGMYIETPVTGPMGEKTAARYGLLEDGRLAVIEIAEAAGITLVDRNHLNPWKATTFGVGEMIKDAISRGCREFIIGLGGSATSDGGIGMLMALGYEFLDENGCAVEQGIKGLNRIAEIRDINVEQAVRECHFRVACDVDNPLLGEQGAVAVYGPQKGVRKEEIVPFDENMRHYADRTKDFLKRDHRTEKGAGAAGGLGFAFLSYLNTDMESGISIVLTAIGLEEDIRDADLVITGEGRLDRQTAMGKTPVGIAKLAKKYQKKVIAFAGGVTADAGKCNEAGIDAYFPIVRGVTTLEEAMDTNKAQANMADTVEQVVRLINM